MADRSAASAERAASFGPFRLLPAQQLLLEGEVPVRLGSRALEILTALVEHAGELIGKNELMARVWPDTFVDEGSLRVHISGLRRALGDGQPGRRYLANVPGRGYRFVAPVEMSEPERPTIPNKPVSERNHNLPVSQSRAVGRAEVIGSLLDRLPKQRFITIVGAGGIGKTTVALALAEMLLPAYGDGVRFVDLAPVSDPQNVPNALGITLGLAVHSEDAIPLLIDLLRDKQALIVLDSCEHVVDATAVLAERLLAEVPGLHIVATSREPLRAKGESVHRLSPLNSPTSSSDLTAAEALAFPAVQLFVERAAAILDGFELSDDDAPIVSDICRKLGGVALAIELAAARVDAFGIRQLSVLLDDRFRILKQAKRTAQARHRSLAAALDWSYEFLPEIERAVLRRLSLFVGAFTFNSAVAVAGDDDTDVVEILADLVAKSLVSADVGGAVVQYRLLDTTRAYAMQKLIENGEFEDYARRHAQHQLDWFKGVEANWPTQTNAEWMAQYGQRIDDLRAALNWTFSPNGDESIAASLIMASIPLWPALATLGESQEYIERALARRTTGSTLIGRVLAGSLILAKGPRAPIRRYFAEAFEFTERMDDVTGQVQSLLGMSVHCLYAGDYREAAVAAEKCCVIGGKSGDVGLRLMGAGVAALAYFYLGDFIDAQRHADSILNQDSSSPQYWLLGFRLGAQNALANLQWVGGFPDKAIRTVESAIEQSEADGTPILRTNALANAACAIALYVGDLAIAESWIETLLDLSTKNPLPVWNARGRCLKGMLLLARGDNAGLELLEGALDWLREANFAFLRTIPTAALAQGLADAGELKRAHVVIDEALERSDRNEERWCMPELLRTKGEIVRLDRSVNADATAEGYFEQALDWARRQEALSWELRAAMSLAQLWHQDGKTKEASNLLTAVYSRFTEGFETADLKSARALIRAISEDPKTRA